MAFQKDTKVCVGVLSEFSVNDSLHHCKLWQLLMVNLLKNKCP